MHDVFLRFPAVTGITGLSRSTIWRLEKSGVFPPRRRLGLNSVAWLRSEVEGWVASRRLASREA